MTLSKLIYIVEDDVEISKIVSNILETHNYSVKVFHDGAGAKRELKRREPDLIILDLMLPDMTGLSLVQETMNSYNCGVFILTGLGSVSDRVLGLEIGADDYITKPFEPRELVARINGYFRRTEKLINNIEEINLGIARFSNCQFDTNIMALTSPDGDLEQLSAKEAEVLLAFLRSPNKVLSREQILNLSSADDLNPFDRSVDVRISRLRKKIHDNPQDPKIIKTIYGAGYMLVSQVEWVD